MSRYFVQEVYGKRFNGVNPERKYTKDVDNLFVNHIYFATLQHVVRNNVNIKDTYKHWYA